MSKSIRQIERAEKRALKKRDSNAKKNKTTGNADTNNKKSEEIIKSINISGNIDSTAVVNNDKIKNAPDKGKSGLERDKIIGDDSTIETVVPVKMQEKFLYFTTSIKKLEKRVRKLRIVIMTLAVCLGIFIGLYLYELNETQRRYEQIFDRAMTDTIDTIKGYEKNPISGDRFYRMITSEAALVRMAAENIEMSDENINRLNDIYYLFIDYPKQMKEKYNEVIDIYNLLLKNKESKEAFDKIDELKTSIDKMGE